MKKLLFAVLLSTAFSANAFDQQEIWQLERVAAQQAQQEESRRLNQESRQRNQDQMDALIRQKSNDMEQSGNYNPYKYLTK